MSISTGNGIEPEEIGEGVFEVAYRTANSNKVAKKTIFDPKVYPDAAANVNDAANIALYEYQASGAQEQIIIVNETKFYVSVAIKKGSNPTVRTAYPIGKVKK